jgi:F-type H+-transporting ATPase subunit delta
MTSDAAYVRAYARALLGAARITSGIPAVQRDLAAVMGALAESPDLRRWICRRVISSPVRRIAEGGQRLAGLVSPMTLRLLLRMAAWNHLHLLPAVAKRFELSVRKLDGRRTAHVVCAQAPDAATLAAIRSRMGGAGAGSLDLDVQTNPALLAGLTIRIDDQVFDASLAGRIARLRQALDNPGRAPGAATAQA